MQILKNLQQKPELIRKSIMWIGIIFVMAVIFTFWILTFPSQAPKTEDNEATVKLKAEIPSIVDSLKSQIDNLQDIWKTQPEK